eukprot:470913-Amphidinium_carterae.2
MVCLRGTSLQPKLERSLRQLSMQRWSKTLTLTYNHQSPAGRLSSKAAKQQTQELSLSANFLSFQTNSADTP